MTKEFGARVRLYRERRGLTQEGLGIAMKMNQANISRLESGENALDIRRLPRLARVLGVSVADLFESEKEPETPEKELEHATAM